MILNGSDWSAHIAKMLAIAAEVLAGPVDVRITGSEKSFGEAAIAMDDTVESRLLYYIREHRLGNVYSEEIGLVEVVPDAEYLLVMDPLDGSTNYKQRAKNPDLLLPHGVLIAVFRGTNKPKLADIVAAGAFEYSSRLGWIYDGSQTQDLVGQAVTIRSDWPVGKDTPAYCNLYPEQDYQRLGRAAGTVVFVRNTGCCVGNVATVLGGVAAATADFYIKSEEIGAVYGLLKGAGATILSPEGLDLEEMVFRPGGRYSLIAGSPNVVAALHEALS